MRLTIPMINKQLHRLGVKDDLVHGDRYFYFRGPVADKWIVSSVEVSKVGDIATLEGWYQAYEALRKKNSDRGISAAIKKIVAKKRK
jgi:hypothetical protein